MHVSDLVQHLPVRQDHVSVKSHSPSFQGKCFERPGYVAPELTPVSVSNSAVTLVSASGAMGKSALADYLAAHLRCPKIDLSATTVGAGSIPGILLKRLGVTEGAQFITDLQSGSTSLILDALDECFLRNGLQHVTDMLSDVYEVAREAVNSSGQIVILGRPDSIDLCELILNEFGATFARYSLEPLSIDAAFDVIANELDRSHGMDDVHRTHPAPAREYWESEMSSIAEAFLPGVALRKNWNDVADFFGYPPVLQAFAEYLWSENPARALSESSKGAVPSDVGGVLRKVCESILDREALKVRELIASAVEWDINDGRLNAVFTRREQLVRVISKMAQVDDSEIGPFSLPPEVEEIYRGRVPDFVADHPFLRDGAPRNAVFGDYMAAMMGTDELPLPAGVDRKDINDLLKPGPFFAEFMSDLSKAKGGWSIVREESLPWILNSYQAAHPDAIATVDQAGSEVQLVVGYPMHIPGRGQAHLRFLVENSSGVVTLRSPAMRTYVRAEGVVLESGHSEFLAGPALEIFSGELDIEAGVIAFVAGSESEGPTILLAKSCAHGAELTVRRHSQSVAGIWWSSPAHQWREMVLDLSLFIATEHDERTIQLLSTARRILLSFKKSAAADPSIHSEFLRNVVIGRSPLAEACLDGLTELGVVAGDGKLSRLRLEALSEYGVSYADLRGDSWDRALGDLGESLLHTEPVRRWMARG